MRNAEVIRQWKILKTIEAGRWTTAGELAEEYGVTERTIRRDIEALQEAGFPLYDDRIDGKKVWRLVEGYRQRLTQSFTLAELSVGPLVAKTAEERAARQAHLQLAEADFDPIPFDSAAARAFAQVAHGLREAGRKPTARAFDALIAATAISRNLPLHTCNPADFEGIPGLDVRPVAVTEPALISWGGVSPSMNRKAGSPRKRRSSALPTT